ncbi:MAG: hypothetical protein ACI9WU_001572 [Myxococcota bacterium]|jgi:hypothetical protein
MSDLKPAAPEEDDPPPILGSWRALYGVVLGTLAGLTALFYYLTQAFS